MKEKLADDLLVGAKAIAEYVGVTERQVFYWGETGRLPLFKIGSKWAGRKSQINERLSKLESGEAA